MRFSRMTKCGHGHPQQLPYEVRRQHQEPHHRLSGAELAVQHSVEIRKAATGVVPKKRTTDDVYTEWQDDQADKQQDKKQGQLSDNCALDVLVLC